MQLLDNEQLNGPVGVRRWLTLERDAHLVDAHDLGDAIDVVEQLCNIWGGAYHLLIPVADEAMALPSPWADLMRISHLTRTAVRRRIPMPPRGTPPGIGGFLMEDATGELPLGVLGRTEVPQGGFRTARVANGLDPASPWAVAYNAVWGRLPATIDAERLRFARLREGTTYADVLHVDATSPATPGAADLLASLRDPALSTGVALSCSRLALASAPTGPALEGDKPQFPLLFQDARECGPNLVVVYDPGSVADLCLLWHLRAVHGLRRGFPLGVPITADVPAVLRYWWTEHAMSSWGLRQTRSYLVSMSVELDILTQIAAATGPEWSVVVPEKVLQPSLGCGISSSEVAVFASGEAHLAALHPAEASALGTDVIRDMGGPLQLVATPAGQTLPTSDTLASSDRFQPYRGGAVISFPGLRGTSSIVRWPTGQAILEAVVRDVGLRAELSAPGRLAATLLRRCSTLGIGMGPLLHPAAQDVLGRLGSRHGMNWFKAKLRSALQIDDDVDSSIEDRLLVIEERVAAMAGEPSVEEQHDLSFDEIRNVLWDRPAAKGWLAWAERAGLILRGAQVRCSECSSRSWQPMASIAPPVVCVGCGLTIERPYDYDLIKFRYRATEFLLRLLKDDAIVHALTLRFFDSVFRSTSDDRGPIVGGYPGVTIRRPESADPLGEADVLFVMIDGRTGVGECKASAAGLVQDEVVKLARLADALNASWTFTATLDRASECGALWHASPTDGRIPHFALTAEHLYDAYPINVIGANPLNWRTSYMDVGGRGGISDEQHRANFIAVLHGWENAHKSRTLSSWQSDE
jgi:hypothetical protein